MYNLYFFTSFNVRNSTEFIFYDARGIFKYNVALSLIDAYYLNTGHYGFYYNQTGDYILAGSSAYTIDVLTRNDFTFIKCISTSPYLITDIQEFNDTLYFSTKNGYVLVLINEVITANFTTLCSSIISLSINAYGEIAIVCSSIIYVYSTTGTYLNVSWVSPINNTNKISFDGHGNVIISGSSGIYIFQKKVGT